MHVFSVWRSSGLWHPWSVPDRWDRAEVDRSKNGGELHSQSLGEIRDLHIFRRVVGATRLFIMLFWEKKHIYRMAFLML